jgi:hypothetical protein
MGSMYPHPHPHPLTRWVHNVAHLCTRGQKYNSIPVSSPGKTRRVLRFQVPIAISGRTRTQRPASEQRPGSPHDLDQFIGGRQPDILCYTRQRWWKILVKQTLDIVCTVYWTFLRNSVANNYFRYLLECGMSKFCSDLGSCCCESMESHVWRTPFIFYFTILQNIWYLRSFTKLTLYRQMKWQLEVL